MNANIFGNNFRVTTFGESHGSAIGVVIDGCPSNVEFDLPFIQSELDRRRPGSTRIGTKRNEEDKIKVLSGVFENRTTGTPIAMIIENTDQKSHDYSSLKDIYRPGHADFTYEKKYGLRDYRGGGRSSGRETAARVAAGALAKLILKSYGIEISAAIRSVKDIYIEGDFIPPFKAPLYTVNSTKDNEILSLIDKTIQEKDSLGGVIECHIKNVMPGLGDPVFNKADAVLSYAIMSIGAVKGIEFGKGFEATKLYGSQNNDEMDENGFLSNNAGGILGGITNGEEIVFKAAFKPTPSIAKEQKTIDKNGNPVKIEIKGRHDPIILVRALVVVESMAALSILDLLLENKKYV